MEITNVKQFEICIENLYKNTCESFGEKFDQKKFKIILDKKIKIFNEKMKPIIDKKFQFVGSENSLFDPIRKIEGIFFLDGCFYKVFKYKRGRKKMTSIINL